MFVSILVNNGSKVLYRTVFGAEYSHLLILNGYQLVDKFNAVPQQLSMFTCSLQNNLSIFCILSQLSTMLLYIETLDLNRKLF